MQPEKSITIINDKKVIVSPLISNFEIQEKPSSNIAFFGYDKMDNNLFIQFKNGSCYLYNEFPEKNYQEMIDSNSVGKYFSQHVAGKFVSVKLSEKLIIIDAILD